MTPTETSRSICLICDNRQELVEATGPVIQSAVSAGQQCVCLFSDDVRSEVRERLSALEPALASAIARDHVRFPEIGSQSRSGHHSANQDLDQVGRVSGAGLPDSDESTVLLIVGCAELSSCEPSNMNGRGASPAEKRITTIYCYDRSVVSPRTLLDALESHPRALVDSKVIPNPYYQLTLNDGDTDTAQSRVDRMINHLRQIARVADMEDDGPSSGDDWGLSGDIPRILESVSGSIVSIDNQGTILNANAFAEAALRIPLGELIGQNVWELFPGAVGSHTYQQIQRVTRDRALVQFETYSSVLGHWIEVTLAPAKDQIWLSIRDITKRKEIEHTLNARVRQQAAVAELGKEALSSNDLSSFMYQFVVTVQQTLEVDFVKILELMPGRSKLRLVAGVGWEPGLVGSASVGGGVDSQAGYTLQAGGPIIVEDLQTESRFTGSRLLIDHDVTSGISVVIPGNEGPYGVLGAHSRNHTKFTQDDVNFVQSVANILAAAIDKERADEIRRHFAAIVASSDDAIIGESLEGTITSWNAAAERMFGYSVEEVVGRPVAMLYPEEFRGEIEHLLDDIKRGRRVERHESVRRTKDGRLIDVSISLSPIRDENGQIVGASKIAVDITDRKRAELERTASESRLQLALEAGRMGTWDWNLGSNVVAWSANMELIHGMTPGSFGGTFEDFQESIHPEDRDRVMSAVRQTLVDNEDYYIEYRNLRPDGSIQWLEARGRIISGGRGRPDHLTGVCTDVTEQVESRQQIARFAAAAVAERDRLQQVVDVIPEGILIADSDGRIVLTNQAARDIWGEEFADTVWQSYSDHGSANRDGESIPVDQLPSVRALQQGERVIGEQMTIQNRATGKQIPLLVNSAPIRNDEGKITGAVTTFQDITAFKEFERQKDEFLQTLSHDLKNPLTSVKGNAQFLRRRAMKSGLDVTPIVDRIETSAVQAVELIDELLDLTRLQMGRPVELVRSRSNIAQLVQDLAEQQASTSRFHRIRVESEDKDLVGHVDEMRVSRVLSNLLNNAIKYSPDNSEIVIEVSQSKEDPGCAEIRVIDHGIGIPESDLPRLFERFRRGSNVEGQIRGSGLGLASSKQIVEQHGGEILVESTEGQGSTFTVLLPLQPPYPPRLD